MGGRNGRNGGEVTPIGPDVLRFSWTESEAVTFLFASARYGAREASSIIATEFLCRLR